MPRLAILLLVVLLPTGALSDITGPATVIDGDSLVVAGHKIRLHGADAFEHDQTCGSPPWPCGQAATEALREIVAGQIVVYEGLYRSYDRVVSICHVGNLDLAAELVRRGLAVAVKRYSTAYIADQARAKEARVGAWGGAFISPAAWRRR